MSNEFAQFWEKYPRHVAKLAAMKAFSKARKIATTEEIIAGVDRYLKLKPVYADWAYPATWLNQGRWMDEPDRRVTIDRRETDRGSGDRRLDAYVPFQCPHEPSCHGRAACDLKTKLDAWKHAQAGEH